MFDFLDGPVRDLVVAVYGAIGYVGVAFIVALESVVIPIPSELVLPFAGFLVADPLAIEPLTGAAWNPVLLVIAGTAGSVLGALIAYAIGFWAGRPFLLRFGRYLLIKPADIERTEAFFARHGGKAAFVGRMIPVVRSLVSYVAGIARMPLLPFVDLQRPRLPALGDPPRERRHPPGRELAHGRGDPEAPGARGPRRACRPFGGGRGMEDPGPPARRVRRARDTSRRSHSRTGRRRGSLR